MATEHEMRRVADEAIQVDAEQLRVWADEVDALRTQIAEATKDSQLHERQYQRCFEELASQAKRAETAEDRVAVLEKLLAYVARNSTHPDRDGPGCWWCLSEDDEMHRADCPYAAIMALSVFAPLHQETTDGK